MTRIECINHTQFWPMAIFLAGSVILTYLIAKRNKIGLKDALFAVAGLKKMERSIPINILHTAIILIPLAIWMWLMGLCDPTLFQM